MAKTRLPVQGTIGKSLRTVDPTTAVSELSAKVTELQAAIAGLQRTQQSNPSGLAFTDWSLISHIPPGIRLRRPGADGADGEDGRPGIRGPRGLRGSRGLQGPPGAEGSEGDAGSRGPRGASGPAGVAGANGTGSPPALATTILADTPLAYWKCTDASTSFADSSGNGFNLTTITGTVGFRAAPLVPSLSTDLYAVIGAVSGAAGNNGIALTSQFGLTFPLLNWSLEAVFFPYSNSGTYRIFDLRPSGGSTTAATLIWVAGVGFEMFYPSTSNTLTAPWTASGTPVHVVVTCSTTSGTSTLQIYANGILLAKTTFAASALTGTMVANIGQFSGNATSPFLIGHVAFYNTVLSAARALAHAKSVFTFPWQ